MFLFVFSAYLFFAQIEPFFLCTSVQALPMVAKNRDKVCFAFAIKVVRQYFFQEGFRGFLPSVKCEET